MENIAEHRIAAHFKGKFPHDISSLSGLGFDKVSVTKGKLLIRKNQSIDFSGKPHLFFEIEMHKKSIFLRYNSPKGSEKRIRSLQAHVFLLRALSLLPGMQTDSSDIAKLVLPSLELSSEIAGMDYELLLKKHTDLQLEFAELAKKGKRLSKASEQSALLAIELENKVSAQARRIQKLEAVSDQSLREMVLCWVASHRGSFDVAAFSKENKLNSARAEEGLEMLLKSGAIARIGKKKKYRYALQKPQDRGAFSIIQSRLAWLK